MNFCALRSAKLLISTTIPNLLEVDYIGHSFHFVSCLRDLLLKLC